MLVSIARLDVHLDARLDAHLDARLDARLNRSLRERFLLLFFRKARTFLYARSSRSTGKIIRRGPERESLAAEYSPRPAREHFSTEGVSSDPRVTSTGGIICCRRASTC